MTVDTGGLGRRVPEDFRHVEKFPLRALGPSIPQTAERIIALPTPWREFYDQGREGACVGFAASQLMSLMNRRRYDARWLWDRAKERDDWPDTNPGDDNGTSVRAAMEVLLLTGHCPVARGRTLPADTREGISVFRWAQSVDEVRWALADGTPVVVGSNWYAGFDRPALVRGEWWLNAPLGPVRGGHAFLLEAVSDRRQAVRTPNSWGARHPRCWLSYETLGRLLREDGEIALVTDR